MGEGDRRRPEREFNGEGDRDLDEEDPFEPLPFRLLPSM